MFQAGQVIGVDGQNFGINGIYAPCVNLHREALNGRNYECYSEDPVISGELAAAFIKGAKSNGVHCYLKHLALYDSGPYTDKRVWLTEQNFRENYLRPFEIAIKDGGANAVMSCFNRIGAVWSGYNYALSTGVLREEWGFRGSMITDWFNNYMNDYERGILAGNDLWLHRMGLTHEDASSDTYAYYARRACKNIIYTYVSTEEARVAAQGGEPVDLTVCSVKLFYGWVWIIVGIEAVMLAALGVWIFFVIKRIRKHNAEKAA